MCDIVMVTRCNSYCYSKEVKVVGNGITEPPYITVWRCSISELGMKEDDYCSYGEKRD